MERGFNLVEKLIRSHLVSGEMRIGSEIAISIDQTLTQDPLGTMAYLQFEAMGVERVKQLCERFGADALTLETAGETRVLHDSTDFHIQGDLFDVPRAVLSHLHLYDIRLKLTYESDIPLRIGVAGSCAKATAILGALRGRYLHTLITDENAFWPCDQAVHFVAATATKRATLITHRWNLIHRPSEIMPGLPRRHLITA